MRTGQNVRNLTDDIFKCIFLAENIYTLIQMSLKYDSIVALTKAWHRTEKRAMAETLDKL